MEICIMPDNPPYWRNYEAVKNHRERYHRHEVFGAYNRQKSIEDGLVIFLRPEQHNMGGKKDIHHNKDYDLIVIPRKNHNVPSDFYFIRRKMDFFTRHLLGAEPPKEYRFEIMK